MVATLAACGDASSPVPAPAKTEAPPAPQVTPAATPAPPPQPTLARQDLVEAAAQAASSYAGGEPVSADDPLVGRPYSVRIPFGCTGPTPPGGQKAGVGHWQWSADGKTIQLGMQPADWKGSALIGEAGASDTWEAIEGFWIPRPWLLSNGCPAVKTDPLRNPDATSPQTLGLAAVFKAGGSRIGRRDGRAYRFTVRPERGTPLARPAEGYRLLLEGRVEAFPSNRAIECRASGPDQRPVCIVAARLDHVAFETPDGSVLAEWRTD